MHVCEVKIDGYLFIVIMTNLVLHTNQFGRIPRYASYIHRMETFVTH